MRAFVTGVGLAQVLPCEVSEDFELPEYQPEVRRVAMVHASVTRDHAFLEDNSLAVSGCVLYTVLYLSGEGGLASAPFFSTWSVHVPLPEGVGISVEDVLLLPDCENVVCRVTGPRRLSLSARVKLSCTALGEIDCTTETSPDAQAILRQEEVSVVQMKTCHATGNVQGETGGGKVITCRGSVQLMETRQTASGLEVHGEAVVRLLVLGDGGSYVPVRSRMPIHETIPTSWDSQCAITVEGYPAALTVSEEDGRIQWEMEYDLHGTMCAEGQNTLATDGYSTTYSDTPQYRELSCITMGRCFRGQVTLSGEKQLRQVGETEHWQFLYGCGRGVLDRVVQEDGRWQLMGTAQCTVLLTGEGDVVTEEVTLPLRYPLEGEGMSMEQSVPDCHMTISIWDVGGHIEGNTLYLHAEAGVSGVLLFPSERRYMTTLTIDKDRPLPPKQPAITLYTPMDTETVWDIQKRYRTTDVTETDTGRYIVGW